MKKRPPALFFPDPIIDLAQFTQKLALILSEMEAKDIYLPKFQTAKTELAKQRKTSRPKIQKVHQTLMKDQEQYELYYEPKLVSFGPIHHRRGLGESKKFMWAVAYMEEHPIGENAEQHLCQKIVDDIVQLKELYTEDVIEGYSDEELAWMLLVDGCAMLYLLESLKNFDLKKIEAAQAQLMIRDLMLLENQLPYELLKLLTNNSPGLMESMDAFCQPLDPMSHGKQYREQSDNVGGPQYRMSVKDPLHLLDHMRQLILPRDFPPNNNPNGLEFMMNIKNLKEAGILGVKIDDDATLCDISFHPGLLAGYLHMPPVWIDNMWASVFQNLKAYELCPDFDNDFGVCSFIVFINLLVNCEEDVKKLRSAGVLLTPQATDKKVVELISHMSRDLYGIKASSFVKLHAEINRYIKSKCKTWVAEIYYTYFRSPWSVIACNAAGIGLLLILIQTLQSSNK